MTDKKFLLIIQAIALAFCVTAAGCSNGAGGGRFTLTDIPPQYNGKYAILTGMNLTTPNLVYVGCQSVSGNEKSKLSRISNGKVTLPMWTIDTSSKVKKYSGSGALSMVSVSVFESETQAKEKPEEPSGVAMFMSVNFSNGSASKSWEEGMATGNPMMDAIFDSIKGALGN
jgi:hypothetical protein